MKRGPWLTVDDAAAQCSVTAKTIREWCRDGRMKHYKPAKAYLFQQAWIDARIAQLEMDLKVKRGPWLTVDDAAAQCGVTAKTIREWCLDGRIKHYKPKNAYLFQQAWIDAWIARLETDPIVAFCKFRADARAQRRGLAS